MEKKIAKTELEIVNEKLAKEMQLRAQCCAQEITFSNTQILQKYNCEVKGSNVIAKPF